MKKVQEAFHCFIVTGEIHNAELQLKRKDGSKIDVLLNVSAIRDEKGKVLYSRSVWRDITERKQAENQLQEAFDELKVKSERLERFQKVTIGREMDMLYLKEEINLLLERLGEPKKYETPDRIRGK